MVLVSGHALDSVTSTIVHLYANIYYFICIQEVIIVGCWKSNDVIICDKYADAVEDHIDFASDKLKKLFPEITNKQVAQTIKFVAGRLSK